MSTELTNWLAHFPFPPLISRGISVISHGGRLLVCGNASAQQGTRWRRVRSTSCDGQTLTELQFSRSVGGSRCLADDSDSDDSDGDGIDCVYSVLFWGCVRRFHI